MKKRCFFLLAVCTTCFASVQTLNSQSTSTTSARTYTNVDYETWIRKYNNRPYRNHRKTDGLIITAGALRALLPSNDTTKFALLFARYPKGHTEEKKRRVTLLIKKSISRGLNKFDSEYSDVGARVDLCPQPENCALE